MKTTQLINYNRKEIQELYESGVITNAQYEAYDFIWDNCAPRVSQLRYTWSNLVPSARVEFWKLYKVLPKNIQKSAYRAACKGGYQ